MCVSMSMSMSMPMYVHMDMNGACMGMGACDVHVVVARLMSHQALVLHAWVALGLTKDQRARLRTGVGLEELSAELLGRHLIRGRGRGRGRVRGWA